MNSQETRDFLTTYRSQFIELSKILKEADTIRENHYSKYTPKERALAIELTERWIKEVFALAGEASTILPQQEDEGIFRRLEEESYGST